MSDENEPTDVGYWTIHGSEIMSMMERAQAGESPEMIYLETFANSIPENMEELHISLTPSTPADTVSWQNALTVGVCFGVAMGFGLSRIYSGIDMFTSLAKVARDELSG